MWSNDRDPMCISFHAMLFYPCRIVTIFDVVISHRRQFSNSRCHRAAVVHHKLDTKQKTLTNEWVICGTISISFWSFWKMFIFVSGWTVTRGHRYTFWYNELQRARLCITLLWLCVFVCGVAKFATLHTHTHSADQMLCNLCRHHLIIIQQHDESALKTANNMFHAFGCCSLLLLCFSFDFAKHCVLLAVVNNGFEVG